MNQPIEQRRLGSSDVNVTRLGLGTSQLGGLFRHVADEDAHAVVRGALDAGITLVDTAPQYGHGTSERRIGTVLREVPRAQVVLSSKVGKAIVADGTPDTAPFVDAPPSRCVPDLTRDGVLRTIEGSLERLGVDHLDVVLIHDCEDHVEAALTEAYPTLHELRREGAIGAIGLGMTVTDVPTRFVRETDIDVVLLAGRYNLLDRSALDDLLPAAVEHGVSVLVAGVYASGVLAAPTSGARYDYRDADAATISRARRIAEVCEASGTTLRAAAVRFPLAHAAVAGVIVGVRSPAQLEATLAAFHAPVPEGLWGDLRAEGLLDDR